MYMFMCICINVHLYKYTHTHLYNLCADGNRCYVVSSRIIATSPKRVNASICASALCHHFTCTKFLGGVCVSEYETEFMLCVFVYTNKLIPYNKSISTWCIGDSK